MRIRYNFNIFVLQYFYPQTMRLVNNYFLSYWVLFGACAVLFSACQPYEPLFQSSNIVNSETVETSTIFEEPTIRIGDKVTVSVWGHDELSIGSVNSPYSSNESTGRWLVIDKTGEVNLPRVGRVRLEGYNTKEAGYFLEKIYERNGLQSPIVNVRVLSHFVTLLGEVKSPGRYPINNEAITLIELVGRAEGFTKYAKTDEVRIVRKQENGALQEIKINFMQLESLAQQNYFLQPDDIIYVSPSKMKRLDTVLEKITPIAGVLTSIAVIYSVFRS